MMPLRKGIFLLSRTEEREVKPNVERRIEGVPVLWRTIKGSNHRTVSENFWQGVYWLIRGLRREKRTLTAQGTGKGTDK
jgi:hypothetical protein